MFTRPVGTPTQQNLGVPLLKANNLSDVENAATARANLGVSSSADSLLKANNLSDLADAVTARENIGIPGATLSIKRPLRVASRFYDYAFGGVGTIRTVIFGDSLANAKPQFLLRYINAQIGSTDPSITTPPTTSGGFDTDFAPSIVAGTFATNPADGYTYWPTGPLNILTASSRVKWLFGGANPTFSRAKIYYIKEPGAGSFQVLVDGGVVTTINASNASVALGVYEVVQASAQVLLELLRTAGTIRIIGVTNSGNETGVRAFNCSVGGLSLANAMSSAQCRSVFTAFLADYAPDLFTWEMDDVTVADLDLLGACLDSGAATTDKIFIASNPSAAQPTSTTRRDDLEGWCSGQSASYFFFDGWTPVSPYQTLVDLGWNGDGTHPTIAYQARMAAALIAHAGLDAFSYGNISKPLNAPWAPSIFGRNSVFRGPGNDPGARLTVETDDSFGYDWKLIAARCLELWTRGDFGSANAIIARFSGNPLVRPNLMPTGFTWGTDAGTRKVAEDTSNTYPLLDFQNTANPGGGDWIRAEGVTHRAYAKVALPTSNNRTGMIIYVSDGSASGDGCMAYSRGEGPIVWRRVSDDVIIF